MAAHVNTADLGRPIRVVLFGGAYFEPEALRFLLRLNEHTEIALLGAFCEGRGRGLLARVANLVRRRRLAAVPILAMEVLRAFGSFARHPIAELRFRRRSAAALRRVLVVPDVHAAEVVARVRFLRPDLGLIYGSPILRPELFEIPRFGTIGIHHGKVPEYRGKKTTFWAMHNGESSAGVTIQRINAGLDTGEIVSEAEVPIEGKSYRRVEAEVEALGTALYIDSIVAIKRGTARPRPQRPGRFRLYRQPAPRDIVRFWWMRHTHHRLRTRAV